MSLTSEQLYRPRRFSVTEDLLMMARSVCESAIENAAECAAQHERSLGRTTRKNARLSDMYANDRITAERCLAAIDKVLEP